MAHTEKEGVRIAALGWAACLLVAAIPWFLPAPDGLSASAWIYAGLFAAVFVGLLLAPAPAAVVTLAGLLAASLLRVGAPGSEAGPPLSHSAPEALRWAFSGFSSPLVWLVFSVAMIGTGVEKTGLGVRIGHILTRCLGKSALGLGYAVTLTETLLALVVPSATARSGVVQPLVMGIPALCRSGPARSPRAIGAYLSWVAFASSCVASSLFLTAFIPNLIALDMLKLANLPVPDWRTWFIAVAPGGLLLLAATPLLAYWLYPPDQKRIDTLPHMEDGRVLQSARHSIRQLTLLILLALTLMAWVIGEPLGFATPATALALVCLLVVCGILDWEDVIGNARAWNLVLWLGAMLSLTAGLDNMGILDWCLHRNVRIMQDFTPMMYLVALAVLFFFSRYAMAGSGVYAAMLLPLFLAAGSSLAGMTPADAARFGFLLAALVGLSGVLTPYATGQGMIWFSAGYIRRGEFWFLGLLFGVIYLAVFLAAVVPWLGMGGIVPLP